jgi:hypothetical protein
MCGMARKENQVINELKKRQAFWTHDPEASAFYFAPSNRAPGPYKEQREVRAILDVAQDGTLAGVELVFGNLPPPPKGDMIGGDK